MKRAASLPSPGRESSSVTRPSEPTSQHSTDENASTSMQPSGSSSIFVEK